MMVLRPRQENLRLVFRLFVSCSAKPRMRLYDLKTYLRFPCPGLNTFIDSISLSLPERNCPFQIDTELQILLRKVRP